MGDALKYIVGTRKYAGCKLYAEKKNNTFNEIL